MKEERIHYLAEGDLAIYIDWKKSVDIISRLENVDGEFSIVDFLEMYCICHLHYLVSKSKVEFKDAAYNPRAFDSKIRELNKLWQEGVMTINNENFVDKCTSLPYYYEELYFKIIADKGIYKKIEPEQVACLLSSDKGIINDILLQTKLVRHFDEVLKLFLISYEKTAELLASTFCMSKDSATLMQSSYSFPSLDSKQYNDIIIRYAKSEKANLNYLRPLYNSPVSLPFKLDRQTQVALKKQIRKSNNEILNSDNANVTEYGVVIELDETESDILTYIKADVDSVEQSVTYRYKLGVKSLINGDLDAKRCFLRTLIKLGDNNHFGLINNPREIDEMEYIFVDYGKDAYGLNFEGRRKHEVALSAMFMLDWYLVNKQSSCIEEWLYEIVDDCIKRKNNVDGLRFEVCKSDVEYAVRVKNLTSEIEGLCKQVLLYIEEGEIDPDFLEEYTEPIRYTKLISTQKIKNIYLKSEKSSEYKRHLPMYSQRNGSWKLKGENPTRYKSLIDLLLTEKDVKLSDLDDHLVTKVKSLMEDGIIEETIMGTIFPKTSPLTMTMTELFSYQYLTPYSTSMKLCPGAPLALVESGQLDADNLLLSKHEIDYIVYVTTKKFGDGLDIRNKYAHGTSSGDKKSDEGSYYHFLVVAILIIEKIVFDLDLQKK